MQTGSRKSWNLHLPALLTWGIRVDQETNQSLRSTGDTTRIRRPFHLEVASRPLHRHNPFPLRKGSTDTGTPPLQGGGLPQLRVRNYPVTRQNMHARKQQKMLTGLVRENKQDRLKIWPWSSN